MRGKNDGRRRGHDVAFACIPLLGSEPPRGRLVRVAGGSPLTTSSSLTRFSPSASSMPSWLGEAYRLNGVVTADAEDASSVSEAREAKITPHQTRQSLGNDMTNKHKQPTYME